MAVMDKVETKQKDYVVFTEKNFKDRVQMCINLIFESECTTQLNIPIKISKRMTRTWGQFEAIGTLDRRTNTYDYKAQCLKFSNSLLNGTYTLKFVEDIMIHEVIHYLVFAKGYFKEGHGFIFKSYCKKHNCALDGTSSVAVYSSKVKETSNEQPQQTYKRIASKSAKYTISCNCGFTVNRTRATNVTKNPQNYRCPNCKGMLNVVQNY